MGPQGGLLTLRTYSEGPGPSRPLAFVSNEMHQRLDVTFDSQ